MTCHCSRALDGILIIHRSTHALSESLSHTKSHWHGQHAHTYQHASCVCVNCKESRGGNVSTAVFQGGPRNAVFAPGGCQSLMAMLLPRPVPLPRKCTDYSLLLHGVRVHCSKTCTMHNFYLKTFRSRIRQFLTILLDFTRVCFSWFCKGVVARLSCRFKRKSALRRVVQF